MTRISLLEAKLRSTLDRTDVLVLEVADQLDARLDSLEDAGATEYAAVEIADARKRLQYARLDYNRGLYKAAHSSLDKAIGLTREVEAREAHTMYSRNVQELFDKYQTIQRAFKNVLTLDPNELKELSVRPGGGAQSLALAGNLNPREFRAEVDELYSRALLINVPPGLEKLHESVINAFAEGRMAATHFEKLVILNRVSVQEGSQLIDEAYRRINTSNRMISAIQSQLIADEVQLRLVQNQSGTLVNSRSAN